MRLTKLRVLPAEQIRGFLERGYVVVKGCIPAAVAREWVEQGWRRSGSIPEDPATWKDGLIHLPFTRGVVIRDFAPKAWDAICDVLGGEERVLDPGKNCWGDTFIVNFPDRAGGEWIPRSGYTGQCPGCGGTEVACDSVAPVVKFLGSRPSGATTAEICRQVKRREFLDVDVLDVEAGDVVLMNPYLIHRSVPNASADHVRFITTQMHALREPPRFDRAGSSAYSPFEVSILRAWGAPSLSFKREPAGAR